MIRIITTYFLIVLILASCSEDSKQVKNPYDNQEPENADGVVVNADKDLDPNSIAALHKDIFKPTCANSGCHDGNFEPDFRTIESSYNTLVNQPIVKNDISDPLSARVVPGSSQTSMLIRRLEIDLNGNSGIMPLVVEPNSDWPANKDAYINRVKAWIDNGALDQQGNSWEVLDYPPQLEGVVAGNGGTVVKRGGQFTPLWIQKSLGSIELYVSFSDDITDPSAYSNLQWNHSIHYAEFDSLQWAPMQYTASGYDEIGMNKKMTTHNLKFTLNFNNYAVGDVIWLRFRLSDATHSIEVPNDNSLFNAKQYCAIRLI